MKFTEFVKNLIKYYEDTQAGKGVKLTTLPAYNASDIKIQFDKEAKYNGNASYQMIRVMDFYNTLIREDDLLKMTHLDYYEEEGRTLPYYNNRLKKISEDFEKYLKSVKQ